MLEVVFNDIVGGFVGLRHIITLHESNKQILLTEECLNFPDSFLLSIYLGLRQTQVYQHKQLEVQFLKGLPADVGDTCNERLRLIGKLSRQQPDLL